MCEHKRTHGGIIRARVLNTGRAEASEKLRLIAEGCEERRKERKAHAHARAKCRRTLVAELPVRRAAYRAASLSEAELTASQPESRRRRGGGRTKEKRLEKEESEKKKRQGRSRGAGGEVGGGSAKEKIIKGGGSKRRSNSRPWPSGGPAGFSCSHFTNKLY